MKDIKKNRIFVSLLTACLCWGCNSRVPIGDDLRDADTIEGDSEVFDEADSDIDESSDSDPDEEESLPDGDTPIDAGDGGVREIVIWLDNNANSHPKSTNINVGFYATPSLWTDPPPPLNEPEHTFGECQIWVDNPEYNEEFELAEPQNTTVTYQFDDGPPVELEEVSPSYYGHTFFEGDVPYPAPHDSITITIGSDEFPTIIRDIIAPSEINLTTPTIESYESFGATFYRTYVESTEDLIIGWSNAGTNSSSEARLIYAGSHHINKLLADIYCIAPTFQEQFTLPISIISEYYPDYLSNNWEYDFGVNHTVFNEAEEIEGIMVREVITRNSPFVSLYFNTGP